MAKSTCALALLLAGYALGQTPNIDVRLGLWETTSVTQSAGMPQIDTSKMTPEVRQRVEESMKARGAKGPTTRTTRECMTKDKIEKNTMFNPQQMQASCKRTIVTNTRSVVEVKVECANEKYPTTATMHFEAVSRENVKGTMKMNLGPMNIDGTINAKWLSDSCGDVK
ncbi:MAG TPA: DUF3617 family protein [Bryobacteraceae bacterium]|jgi:hypothetical protein|nr:DUF3617 family protein [Bryobacteraceae bacterium]